MTEMVIKRHSFDQAQKRLREFSEKREAELEIEKVETDGGFLWLFDHNVTGTEFNDRLDTIQKHFIAVNQTNNNVIKEFREVYNALDALDKDYIASIVANVKAIEKTSNDVRVQQGTLAQHHKKLEDQQGKLDAHQVEIKKNVAVISKIITTLTNYKEKLEAYEHLGAIDEIWSDCQKWHKEIPALLNSVSETVSIVEKNKEAIVYVRKELEDTNNTMWQISNSLKEQSDHIESLCVFVEDLKTITHLRDIDGMWDSLSNANASLEKLFAELESAKAVAVKHQQDIDKALSFIEMVSQYEHLKDIDTIWSDVDKHSEKLNAVAVQVQKTDEAVAQNQKDIVELNQGLSAIAHLNDVDTLWTSNETHSEEITELQEQGENTRKLIQQNKDLADQSLADEKSRIDTVVQNLNKKIQYAYWIAGGSMALALIELFVILLG